MDTAHKADDDSGITLRALEPADAHEVSALTGAPGTFEGTLQLPDMPVATRLEWLQKLELHSCRLVAVAQGQIVGSAGLHQAGMSLRRAHVRMLGIGIAAGWQGKGVGRLLITLYLCRVMGVPLDVTGVMVVAAATPVGVLITIFAAELKAEPEFISTATVITTALSPLTVTAWIIASRLW